MKATRIRQAGLALVMVGALSVSVRGQVQAVAPLLGGMGVVLALTNDLAALLALNELISTRRRDVRRWAWAVLAVAGGTTAGLNTWHAVAEGRLPPVWAVVVGIGPVLLAVLLSHLVALVLADTSATTTSDSGSDGRPGATTQASTPKLPAQPAELDDETPRAGQVTTPLPGPGVHHGLAVVRTAALLPPEAPRRLLPPEAPAHPAADVEGPADERVARVVGQLRAGHSLTGADVAEQEACSDRTGRRLLQQAQQHLDTAALDAVPDPARVTG